MCLTNWLVHLSSLQVGTLTPLTELSEPNANEAYGDCLLQLLRRQLSDSMRTPVFQRCLVRH